MEEEEIYTDGYSHLTDDELDDLYAEWADEYLSSLEAYDINYIDSGL